MKKCKACNGKGFTFDSITMIKLGFSLYEKGIKVNCRKCFGKGVKR